MSARGRGVKAPAGAAGPQAQVSFPYEAFEHATISMRCVRFD